MTTIDRPPAGYLLGIDAGAPDGGSAAVAVFEATADGRLTRFDAHPADRVTADDVRALDPDLVPLDPTCPYCKGPHGVDEAFDGSERRCGNCGRWIVMVVWNDDTASMIRPTPDPYANQRTGRQRTRALWRRRGRR